MSGERLRAAIEAASGRRVLGLSAVAGGDINEAYRAELDGRGAVFVKTRAGAEPGEYATEPAGLEWLLEAQALPLPAPVAVVDAPERSAASGLRLLALDWIEPAGASLTAAATEAFGRGLAALHGAGAPCFGGPQPLRIGALTLPNDATADWPSFYAERRLLPLARRANEQGALSAHGRQIVENVCERLAELSGPPEAPARLHGDLWSGNVLAGADGCAWLIDPAAYGGHREVDLAMLRLFGAPSERLFSAYQEVAPLAPGHEQRVALWQLFPLLVHAVLFGGGYGAGVERAAARYAG